ncbi:hypothetical protein SeMB42_g00215 [Synchytrium endobioticum]|uniref:Uncharacterized protein n=1 Tax=Synchytrium endobioticum TaxID=286115 RepID=A0A507DTJ6_9FUNG|nr:hypothetical protein SeMB42_g00215 [Synchytrium endobioticum]
MSHQQHAGSLHDPFRLSPQTYWKTESVYNEPQPVPTGIVLQQHIEPSFSRRIDLGNSRQNVPLPADILQNICSQDFNITLRSGPSDAIFVPRKTLCRVRIHPLTTSSSFPQCHRVVLSLPLDNILELWQFQCDPFTFRTLVNEHSWELSSPREKEVVFEDFGGFLMRRIHDCVTNDARFVATLTIDPGCNNACLAFEEIVHGYRTVSLLNINFRPVPWDAVVKDISQEYARLKDIQSAIKSVLVEGLDLTSKQAPQVMLDVVENVRDRPLVSWTQEEIYDGIPVYAQTIPLKMKIGNADSQDEKLTFTIFADAMDASTTKSYRLLISSPNDIMFKLESGDISQVEFYELTRQLKVSHHHEVGKSKTRTEILGFHPQDGVAGGVVGVLARDFLSGVGDEPQRYSAELRLEAIDATPAPINYNKYHESPPRPTAFHPKRNRHAKLIFHERVLFRTQEMLSLNLHEADPNTLAPVIQRKFALIADDIRTSRHRIMALLEAARPRRDPSLYSSLLDTLGVWVSSSGNGPMTIPARQSASSRLSISSTPGKKVRIPIWKGGSSPARASSPSSPTSRSISRPAYKDDDFREWPESQRTLISGWNLKGWLVKTQPSQMTVTF